METVNNSTLFKPIQCQFETIKKMMNNEMEVQEGALYFSLDTQEMYLGKRGSLISIGGNTGIIYAENSRTDLNNQDPMVVFIKDDFGEDVKKLPAIDDLVLNVTDGCFYRVTEVLEKEESVKAKRLTISGSGGGGGGGGGFNSNSQVSSVSWVKQDETGLKPQTVLGSSEENFVILNFASTLNNYSTGYVTRSIFINNTKVLQETVQEGNDQKIDFNKILNSLPEDILNTSIKPWDFNSFKVEYKDIYSQYLIYECRIFILDLNIALSNWASLNYSSGERFLISGKYTYPKSTTDGTETSFKGNQQLNIRITKQGTTSLTTYPQIDSLKGPTGDLSASIRLQYGAYDIEIQQSFQPEGSSNTFLGPIYSGQVICSYDYENYSQPLLISEFEVTNIRQEQGVSFIEQGSPVKINYILFDPKKNDLNPQKLILSTKEVGADEDYYSRPEEPAFGKLQSTITSKYPYGDILFTIFYNNVNDFYVTKTYQMKVQENENIDSNAGALALFLTANGKNNNDVEDRDKWLSDDGKNYATFSKMFWTAGASGWSVDSNGESYLKLSGSSTATIDFYPFSNISNHGFTLEFDFSVENLSNLDAIVMDCYSGGTGFRVYGDKINFYQGGETVRCDFPTGQKIKVNLIVTSPDEKTGQGFYQIYLNGVATAIRMYTLPANGNLGDVFNQTAPAKISLGSSLCDLNFYSIKYYNIALSDNNVVNNYLESIISTSNYTEKIQKNDIYDNLKENITFEGIKNNGNISYMILTGNALPLTKNQEDLLVDIEYKCAFDDTLSFTEKDASIALQGTSSVRYRRKNYKIKCKNKHLLDYGQIKTKTFCLKADYAEATGTHNTQTANMVENFYAIGSAAKTPPQYKVLRDNNFNTELTNLAMPRTTIYGYPIVLFQRTYNEMGAEKIEFIGKYNFNFDKGSKEVFGFTDDNPGAECWEFRFNEKPACIFKEEIELDVWNAWIQSGTAEDATTRTYERFKADSYDEALEKVQQYIKEQSKTDAWYKNVTISNLYPEWVTSFEPRYSTVPIEDKYGNEVTYIEPENKTVEDLMDISHFKSLHDWICSTDTTKVYSTADEENSHLNKALTEKQIEEMSKWTADKDHTEDSVEYRRAKFKQEFNNYFDLEYVLIYYVYTFFALMVDQRAKNMFFTYWEPLLDENGEQIEYNGKKIGGKWQPWFYDNDTCFGIDNEGDLRFDYYHEDDARDGFVFQGEQSVLWINFRTAFSQEISTMYNTLSGNSKGISLDNIKNRFITQGANKWSEAIYNEDIQYKYIDGYKMSKEESVYSDFKPEYLKMVAGTGALQLERFIPNRLFYCNTKWSNNSGDSKYDIQFRAEPTPANQSHLYAGRKVTLKPVLTGYYGVRGTGGSVAIKDRIYANTTKEFDLNTLDTGNIDGSFLGGAMIGSFGDMSGLYLRSITLPTSGLMVQDLIFGSEAEGYNNDGLDNVQLSGCPLLKTLNISNLSSYSGILEISNCFNIKEIYAAGTKISKVNLPAFSWLNTLKLPETITELALINQVDLANSGLIFSSKTGLNPYRNISTLTINNCPKLDSYVLLNQVLNGMKEQIPTLIELKESIPLNSINASLEITQEIKNTLNNVGINTDNYFEQRGTKFKIKSGFEDTFKEEFENKVINYKKLKIDIKNIDWKFSSTENGEQFLLTLIDLISNPDTQAEYWITLEAPSLIGDCFIDATVSGASMALFKKTFPQLNVDAADTSSLISFYQWDEQSKTAIPLYRLEEKSYRKNEIISEFEYSRIKKIKSNEKFIFIEDNEFDIYFEIQDSGYKIKEDFNGLVIKLDENNDFITYTQTVRKGGYIYNPQDDLINDIYYSEMLSKKSTMQYNFEPSGWTSKTTIINGIETPSGESESLLFSASNPIYGNKDIYVVYKNNIRSHLVSFYNIKDKYGNQTLLSDETQKYYINYGSNVPQEVLVELNEKLIHPDYPNDYIPAGGNNYYENWDSAPVYITGPKSFTAKYIFNSYYSTKLINKEIVEYTVPITISTIGSKAFYQCQNFVSLTILSENNVCGIAEDALNETPFTNPSFGLEAYVFVPNETIRQDYINDSNWKKVLGPNIANKIKIIGETQGVNN